MIIKSAVLAMLLFFGSLGVAIGQSSSDALGTSTKGTGSETAVPQAIVFGWNYRLPIGCTTFPGSTFVLVGHDNSSWSTTDPVSIATLTPACQTGNWVAFHVINANGVWNQVFVFPFK